MPPNPAQKVPPVAHRVPPGPHSRDVNSCPREREGGCVCVFIPFFLNVRFVDVPAGVTQEEGHT